MEGFRESLLSLKGVEENRTVKACRRGSMTEHFNSGCWSFLPIVMLKMWEIPVSL